MCVCVCVCLLAHNLGEYFVSLLDEPSDRKNMSPSDKQLWQFLKNVSVAENRSVKSYQSVAILKFLCFADVSRKHRKANFCIFEALFLELCPSS